MIVTESKFWSVFSPGPILEALGNQLHIGDIINLSRTCKGLSGIYRELLTRQWDVDHKLKRFFQRPKAFRLQLGLAEALITGSFAVEFFERSAWQATNLDILVVEGRGADTLGDLLLSENYALTGVNDMPIGNFFKHVIWIHTYTRVERPSQEVRVYILSNASFPIRSILEGFWSTSMINFLSWKTAYSVFPSQTFLHYNSYLLQRPSLDQYRQLQKYYERGWSFNLAIPVAPDDSSTRPSMRKTRMIGDRMCWKIPLNTATLDVPNDLDPVRRDDHVSIGEIITGVDQETLERLKATGACRLSGGFVNHYDVKYMRYCGFLY